MQVEKEEQENERVNDPNSYELIAVVNHLGISSNSGHYTSDAFSLKTKQWLSYDDTKVELISEQEVFENCTRTGYIFFYVHK